MHSEDLLSVINKIEQYITGEEYKGWDPYDGLNSKVFKATALKDWDITRLIWIQLFKRSPINFRRLMMVPKEYNPKGIALLLTGYCNFYKIAESGDKSYGTINEILQKINYLAELLIHLQSKGYSGSCWGYNFDWQARRLFYFPAKTPNAVVTSFCANALFKAYEITKNNVYFDTAILSKDFIIKDLKRTKVDGGFLFSYSPIEGNNTVYNAALLASKILSIAYSHTKNSQLKSLAEECVSASIKAQREDGSWYYGASPSQKWIDSFHTGYNLDGLIAYQKCTGDMSFADNIERGFEFYINNFFYKNGKPKYYYNKTYPIDIHCPAQLFVTLYRLEKFSECTILANKVLCWTIENMQTKNGYFIYQKKKIFSSNVPYMRWSQAFMMYALSYYLLSVKTNS